MKFIKKRMFHFFPITALIFRKNAIFVTKKIEKYPILGSTQSHDNMTSDEIPLQDWRQMHCLLYLTSYGQIW